MEVSTQSSSDSVETAERSVPNKWGPSVLIIIAAIAIFAVFAENHLSAAENFSLQGKLIVAGFGGVMGLGILWEIASGQRTFAETMRFWSVVLLVGITTWAIRIYEIESTAFYKFIAPLTLSGFIINHYLPTSLRRPFFLGLGLVAIIGVFGVVSIPAAVGLIGASLVLIGICHLPVSIWIRLALLLACTAGLAAFRSGFVYTGWVMAILPVLAAIFMFRLAIYLYDISNGKGPKNIWDRLSYFFLFPNIVFPFFPAVDYSTYGRTYYNDEATRIYRHGATYILRGFVHLLLYRLIHVEYVLGMNEVTSALGFLQYVVSNFGLYLKVSGLFHLIVGLIVLFGYNLPETHSRFYFSTSFIDFWRRINIYWKDFMQKMVFNPSYMVFKKMGVPHMTGVMLAIATVFIATWALHAYQWYWLTGTVLLTLPDVLFWLILGALLIGQTWLEARPKSKQPSPIAFIPPKVTLVIRTVSTFLFICILWSFWTSPTAHDWVDMVARAGLAPAFTDTSAATPADWGVTLASAAIGILLCVITLGIHFGLAKPAPRVKRNLAKKKKDFYGAIVLCGAIAVGLVALQNPKVHDTIGARQLAEDIGASKLNAQDQIMLERGYYEGLISSQRFNGELWEFFMQNPGQAHKMQEDYEGVHFVDSYMEREYVPNATYSAAGVTTPTNQWGMDDYDYPLTKPEGAYRVAILGASRTRGRGVERDKRFTSLLRQDFENESARPNAKYEMMNFSFDGQVAAQRVLEYESKVRKFRPDIVFFVAGIRDSIFDHHARMIRQGVPMPWPFLDDINARAGLNSSMTETEISRRLAPYRLEFVQNVYKMLGKDLEADGIRGVWIYVPSVDDDIREHEAPPPVLEQYARDAGFETINLANLFDGLPNRDDYRISRFDTHPNEAGHRLIADAISKGLKELDLNGRINMGLSASSDAPEGTDEPAPEQ
jgi:D-alanyl-lipoteichoic acid acyltransferase DltB (MBOAT superfamily)